MFDNFQFVTNSEKCKMHEKKNKDNTVKLINHYLFVFIYLNIDANRRQLTFR